MNMNSATQRAQLSEFLKSCRGRLSPQVVGRPPGGRPTTWGDRRPRQLFRNSDSCARCVALVMFIPKSSPHEHSSFMLVVQLRVSLIGTGLGAFPLGQPGRGGIIRDLDLPGRPQYQQ